MEKWPRRLVMGFAALVAVAVVTKTVDQAWHGGDFFFVFVRWPLLFVGLFLVLAAVRVFFWKKKQGEKEEK